MYRTTNPTGGTVMDYSSRILNLRLDTRAEVAPMKFGHADARHAAAEIARQAEAKIEELEAKLAKAVRERDEALNQLFIAAEVAEGAGAGAILYLRLLQLRVAELRGQDDE